jgi:DNA-binding NtrC family response regulator
MKILIVDDEKLARLNILRQLDPSFSVSESSNFEDARERICHEDFDICYIDLKLDNSPDLLGLQLIPMSAQRGIYTVVMTSIEDEIITEKVYEMGCRDVYNKGNEAEHISSTINRYFLSKDSYIEDFLFKDILPTNNTKYKNDLKKLLKIIPTEIPICILGESGTGKSHLARVIHSLSKRKGSFVELNCATFSGDTLKSELFGHARGAFTGASSDKMGKLFEANQGTLFLDEIGSMSLDMQEGLLKAIEEKSFYPVGSNKLMKSDFRVICATLDDLEILIKSGKFRFDLFQRISGYTFTQPALRDRREDIFPIIKKKLDGSRKIVFKDEAKEVINHYSWPGNIRELLRFSQIISHSQMGLIRAEDVIEFTRSSDLDAQKVLLDERHYNFIKKMGLKQFLDQLTREVVSMSLSQNGNRARVAIRELGISSATFYRYLDKDLPKTEGNNFLNSGFDYELQ